MTCGGELDLERLARDSLHFRRTVVELAPDEELRIESRLWRDAIVFLENGEIEVECAAGDSRPFAAVAVLCFPSPVRLLRNRGNVSARLIAISRRRPAG
jgi:hypothetical protein